MLLLCLVLTCMILKYNFILSSNCCIYLNKVSLLLHTRFRTTHFQQNNPTSTKTPDSKTLCSIYEVTLDGEFKDLFVPFLLSLCTPATLSSLIGFLLYPTIDASLLSPQTTSMQNPILQSKRAKNEDSGKIKGYNGG